MATAAQVDQFRRGYDEISRMVERDLRRVWPGVRNARPEAARNILLDLTVTLTARYGEVAAGMAAEWFETTTGRPAALADLAPAEAVQASTRAGAGGLWTGGHEDAFSRISASTVRHSLQPGRSTIARSAGRNGMRYARAPEPGACAWCLMLASRGAVFGSAAEAQYVFLGAGAGGQAVGEKYHDDCRCVPEAVRSDADLSYDSRALYEQYAAVHQRYMDDRDIAAAMREAYALA